jgi:penicillin amidase
MDLMRRKSAGRLAEVFGDAAVDIDIKQRHLQPERAARAVAANLPVDQLNALTAYVAGVNTAIKQMRSLPFEFRVLNYKPEPWRLEDSLLVAFSMFQILSDGQESERMLTVMEQALPASVTAFLTPDVDEYDAVLTGGTESWRPKQRIPVQALADLVNHQQLSANQGLSIDTNDLAAGSNAWVVAGSKTSDGRAILANDMHLPLRVPNIWYRATLNYTDNHSKHMVSGVSLPGLPLIIAGSNHHLAWGYTNSFVDLIDLVTLNINPHNPDQYKTVDGWQNFEHIKEQIKVKDSAQHTIDVRYTRWGPVSPRTLLDKHVALKWTALDASAVNLGLLHMHQATSLKQAVSVMNNAGGPPQNAMLADKHGRIAWTLMGKLPKRHGFDGSISRSWTNNSIGWDGYINPQQTPRVIDPASGFLATANNRTVGKEYPYPLGHDYQVSFRVSRINQRLQAMHNISETDMLNLQLDTRTEFYRYYQKLAVSVLTPQAIAEKPSRQALHDYIISWDGHAKTTSTGFPVLFKFRKALAKTVLSAYLQPCQQLQNDFEFSWSKKETPLRQLLDAKIPATLPHQDIYTNWDALILAILEKTTETLKNQHNIADLADLSWGRINITNNNHPFSSQLPLLSSLLDMPKNSLAGCPYCVRVVYGLFGASERMAISPGHLQQGILHMPAGQSGHPLSSHYGDQQVFWENGKALPFISDVVADQFELLP